MTNFYIAGGSWELWITIVNSLKTNGNTVKIGSRTGSKDTYMIWHLKNIDFSAIGIILTPAEWVEKSLRDLKDIPVIIASTWFDINLLLASQQPRLNASNLALPVVSLFQVFSEFKDFSGMSMQVEESHQPWKKDPSGTAMKIGNEFKDKGWAFNIINEENYQASEWTSKLWDLTTYRWSSSHTFWVTPNAVDSWHGYHSYKISGSGESFEILKQKIKSWYEKYSNSALTGFKCSYKDSWSTIEFSHDIDGREIYADGLKEILPWFKEKEAWVYSVEDYLNQ